MIAEARTAPAIMPTTEALLDVLRDLIGERPAEVSIVERHANPYTSTYPSEVVTVRAGAGSPIRLLCKYAPTDHEARVHRAIAEPSGLTLPHLLGTHRDGATGVTWLVFSYVDGLRLGAGPWPDAIEAGAAWAGRFHAFWAARMDDPALTILPRRDAREMTRRVARAHDALVDAPATVRSAACWLTTRWDEVESAVTQRLAPLPPTVIHGEFYVDNVLYAAGAAWPVDWEQAAVGVGELDIAALTDRWGAAARTHAARAYDIARHGRPDATPPDRWDAARLSIQLDWIAEGLDWTDLGDRRRLDEARRASRALGIA